MIKLAPFGERFDVSIVSPERITRFLTAAHSRDDRDHIHKPLRDAEQSYTSTSSPHGNAPDDSQDSLSTSSRRRCSVVALSSTSFRSRRSSLSATRRSPISNLLRCATLETVSPPSKRSKQDTQFVCLAVLSVDDPEGDPPAGGDTLAVRSSSSFRKMTEIQLSPEPRPFCSTLIHEQPA